MKRKIKFSIAAALGVALLSAVSFHSTAHAQLTQKFKADSGIVSLGETQVLRLNVQLGAGNDAITIRFRRFDYVEGPCNGGACKLAVASQSTSNPITLMGGEAAYFDIPSTSYGVKGVVVGQVGTGQKVRVTGVILDTTTGKADAFFDIFTELS